MWIVDQSVDMMKSVGMRGHLTCHSRLITVILTPRLRSLHQASTTCLTSRSYEIFQSAAYSLLPQQRRTTRTSPYTRHRPVDVDIQVV